MRIVPGSITRASLACAALLWVAAAPSRAVAETAGDEAAAKALLAKFLAPGADHAALTKELKPTTADYEAVFEPEFAKKLEAAQAGMWSSGKAALAPKEGQTELLLHSATTEQLKAWPKEVSDNFPGGYKRAAAKFKDGLTVYRFKFVKPGETTGMAFDGLVFVNGNWRLFPKPWQAVE